MKTSLPCLCFSRSTIFARLVGLLLVLLLPLPAQAAAQAANPAAPAADGALDPGFGSGGVLTASFGGHSQDFGRKVLVQPDGKLLLAGTSQHSLDLRSVVVARFLPTHQLDASFGGGSGPAGRAIAYLNWSDVNVVDAALQADGKLVVAGVVVRAGEQQPDFALLRFTADGQVDAGFGADGLVTTDFGADQAEGLNSLAIQPDGKLVAAGYTTLVDASGSKKLIALARYNSDGSLDSGYSLDGRVVIDNAASNVDDQLLDIVAQADGKIAGLGRHLGNQLVRFNPDGSLDSGFGAGGWVSVFNTGDLVDSVGPIALYPGDKLLVSGVASSTSEYYMTTCVLLGLWNSDGSLATSFAGDGVGAYPSTVGVRLSLADLAVQPDGQILVGIAGNMTGASAVSAYRVLRVTGSGSLDTGFGSAGWVMGTAGLPDAVTSLAPAPDGSGFWVGGYTKTSRGDQDFDLRRFTAAGQPDAGSSPAGLDVSDGSAAARALALTSDNKILAAGWFYGNGRNASGNATWLNSQGVLARYTTAGALDPAFNNTGLVISEADPLLSSANIEWVDVQRLPDGRVLLAGNKRYNDGDSGITLARYNADGSPDYTFGSNGSETYGTAGATRLQAMALQPDGDILLAGYTHDTLDKAFLMRVWSSGIMADPGFDGDGCRIEADAAANLRYTDVTVQPDGRILAAGQRWTPAAGATPASYSFLAARYNADGSLDTSFDGDGLASVDVSGQPELPQGAQALALQPDGGLVLAGYAQAGAQRDFALLRLTGAGAPDAGFSTDGRLLQDFAGGDDQANDLLLLPDGRLLAGGFRTLDGQRSFALARWSADGTPDAGFGTAGQLALAPGAGSYRDSQIHRLLLQPDGSYLAAGQAWFNDTYEFTLVRLQAAPAAVTLNPGDTRELPVAGLTLHRPADGGPACSYLALRSPAAPDLGAAVTALPVTWSITSDCPSLPLDLAFHYNTSDLAAGVDEAALQAHHRPSGQAWTLQGGTPDPAANHVGVSGVAPDGEWGLGRALPITTPGVTTTQFGGRSQDSGWKMLPQPDGKVVMVGTYGHDALQYTLAVARFNPDATPDTGFGLAGWTYARDGWGDISVWDAVLQADGKIVVAGNVRRPGKAFSDFALVRFTPAGALDETFGQGGLVVTDFGPDLADQLSSLALQADGKLVAAGLTTVTRLSGSYTVTEARLAMARYNPDGSLDGTFGTAGRVVVEGSGDDYDDDFIDIAVQADGKIVGLAHYPGRKMARFNADGSLDTAFGTGGWVAINASGNTGRLALAPDGKIVAYLDGSPVGVYSDGILLARWNSDGSPDSGFDGDGMAYYEPGDSFPVQYELLVQPDGKLLVSFAGRRNYSYGDDFGVLRTNADGSLDTGFGESGVAWEDFSQQDGPTGLALLPDGRFWVGGYSETTAGDRDFLMYRFTANGQRDGTTDRRARLNLGNGSAMANSGVLAADGSVVTAGRYLGSRNISGTNYAGSQAVLAQYDAAGKLDSSFGSLGSTTAVTRSHNLEWTALARQADGKLLAAGATWDINPSDTNIFMARYHADGRLDTSFSGDGSLSLDLGGGGRVTAMALQADGKIVLAGYKSEQLSAAFLVRLTAEGQFDPSFDGDGKRFESLPGTIDEMGSLRFTGLAIQPDGRLVVGGQRVVGFHYILPVTGSYAFLAARYLPDGTPDASFDGDGFAYADVSGQPARAQGAQALALQPDGKLVLAGYADTEAGRDFAALRYTAEGSLDPEFSGDGRLLADFSGGFDQANDLLLLPDGKLLAGGSSGRDGQRQFALARWTPDGALDATFGTGGQQTLAVGLPGAPVDAQINHLLLLPDGRYVAIGQAWVGDNYEAALAYEPEPASVLNPGETLDLPGLGISLHRPADGGGACAYWVTRSSRAAELGTSVFSLPVSWTIRSDCPAVALDLSFAYSQADLAGGASAAGLQAYRRVGAAAWAAQGGASNPAANQLSLSGVNPVGDWTLAQPLPDNAAALAPGGAATIAGVTIHRPAQRLAAATRLCMYAVERANVAILGVGRVALPVTWTVSSGCPGEAVDLALAYADADLAAAGVIEAGLQAYQKSTDAWTLRAGTLDPAANRLSLAGMLPAGRWILAQATGANTAALTPGDAVSLAGLTIRRPAAGGQVPAACVYAVERANTAPALGGALPALPVTWTVASGCPSLPVALSFAYTDAELAAAGAGESELQAYQQPAGAGWLARGGTVDPAANQLSLAGMLPAGGWGLGAPAPLRSDVTVYLPVVAAGR